MAGAYGLYTHIASNRRRSVLMIGGLFLSLYAIVYAGALAAEALRGGRTLEIIMRRALEGWFGMLPFATLAGGAWIGVAYKFHQSMIDTLTDSHDIDRKTDPRLYNLLENLCISRGIPMPKLKIMESEQLNAFASGMTEQQYAVTVTRGLLDTLDDAELEAVLAHELTHIRNGDVRMMVVAVIVAGIVAFVAELIWRWISYGPRVRFQDSSDGEKRANPATAALIIAGAIVVIAWFSSGFLRFALSRSREYLADAGAVELTKNPDAMITALMKISGRAELAGAPSGLMEMCIENEDSGFVDMFATHPPIDERIKALVDHAGGRMPDPAALAPPAQQAAPEIATEATPTHAPQKTPSFTEGAVLLDAKLKPWGTAQSASPWRR